MSYSKSLLLYQDEPVYGALLKLLSRIMPAGLIIAGIYLFSSGETTGGFTLLAESFLIGAIFWFVFPRRYEIYEDHLRIVLGGPVSMRIGFDRIKAIRVTGRMTLSMNFVTRFTKNYVEIARKRALSIAITPRDNKLFVENANQAWSQWAKTTESRVPAGK